MLNCSVTPSTLVSAGWNKSNPASSHWYLDNDGIFARAQPAVL